MQNDHLNGLFWAIIVCLSKESNFDAVFFFALMALRAFSNMLTLTVMDISTNERVVGSCPSL